MSKTLQGKYADRLNKQIEELYKTIDAKDKIIKEQVLETSRLKERIDKALKELEWVLPVYTTPIGEVIHLGEITKHINNAIAILGDKENESS